MENIQESVERKIRLLDASLVDYKRENYKLKVVSEESDLTKSNYDELKLKYNELMAINVKYEPIQSQLNEWRDIIRDL